jgi:hypothetical protein
MYRKCVFRVRVQYITAVSDGGAFTEDKTKSALLGANLLTILLICVSYYVVIHISLKTNG